MDNEPTPTDLIFLIGWIHGSIVSILKSEIHACYKLEMLQGLEIELRKKIHDIFYPNPYPNEHENNICT